MSSPSQPISILRVLPLIGASNILTSGIQSAFHMVPFTSLPIRPTGLSWEPPAALGYLISGFFYKSTTLTLTNVLCTVGTATYNWQSAPRGSRRRKWYGWTALASAAHLLFIPFLIKFCEDACSTSHGNRAVEDAVKSWFKVQSLRTALDAAVVGLAVRAATV